MTESNHSIPNYLALSLVPWLPNWFYWINSSPVCGVWSVQAVAKLECLFQGPVILNRLGRAGGGEDFGDQMIFGEGRGISRRQQIIRRTLCGIIRLLQSLIRESVNFKKVNIRSPL